MGDQPAMLPETIRRWFHVPGPGPYFMAHSAGAKPVAAGPAIEEQFLKPWRDLGGDAWSIWLPAIDGFRDSLAAIIGGAEEEICPQPNVSAAFEHYLGALPWIVRAGQFSCRIKASRRWAMSQWRLKAWALN